MRMRLLPANLERWTYLLFLLPLVVIAALVILYPVLKAAQISLTDINLARPRQFPSFVGLGNYLKLLGNHTFRSTIMNTLFLVVGSVTFQVVLGLALAVLLNRPFPGFGVVRTLILLPMVISPVVAALTWSLLYNPSYGLLRYFLNLLDFASPEWLSDPSLALMSIMIVDIWQWTPFAMLLLLAGLQSVSPEIYEAAEIDGASRFQLLTRITLPVIKPLVGVVILIRSMDAFKIFEKIYILTGGGPGNATETVAFFAYRQGFGLFHMGRASSAALILLTVVLALNFFLLRATQREYGK